MTALNTSATFSGYGVDIDGAVLGGITSVGLSGNAQVRGEAVNGDWLPRFKAVSAIKPVARFTTYQLTTALAACGIAGLRIDANALLKFYGWKQVKGGTRSATTDNQIATINSGLLVPASLSCNHQGDAQLSYECPITWDGSNLPIVFSTGAVPAGIDDDERFSLGAIAIGGTTIDRVQSVNINFGVKVDTEGGQSEIYDDQACISLIDPKISIRTRSLAGLAKWPFAAGTIANTTIVFRKRTAGGEFAGSGQVTLAAAGTITLSEPFSTQGQGTAEQSIDIDVHYDGTNDILKFT